MKKNIKRIFSMLLVFAVAVSAVGPIKVKASASTNKLTVTFRDGENEQGKVQYSLDDGATWIDVTSNINNQDISVTGNNFRIRIVPNEGFVIDPAGIEYSEDDQHYPLHMSENGSIAGGLMGSNGYQSLSTATHVYLNNVEFSPAGEGDHHFDGRTYLIWSCGTGTCYHEYTDMDQNNTGVFIDASMITADNNPSEKFDVHAKVRIFADPGKFDDWKAHNGGDSIDWTKVDPEQLVGPDGVDYQPVGEPGANNAFVSYGDRNFKVIIYNNEYKGVSIGSLDGLTYYPSAWTNQLIRTDSVDISGTTASKPAEIDTVLLEDTINITPKNINGLNISSIEALDVPKNAVKITKNSDGSYKFKFASRFYNHVVFKITDSNNKSYYLRLNRQTMYTEFMHGLGDDRDFAGLVSDFYYDRNTTYTDYKITAKIVYKSGKVKFVEMKNAKFIDDGLGNSLNIYENDEEHPSNTDWPVGKGLKRATYKYAMSEDEAKTVSKIYVNVEFTGSTSSKYAGTLAGSGMGEEVTLPNFR